MPLHQGVLPRASVWRFHQRQHLYLVMQLYSFRHIGRHMGRLNCRLPRRTAATC